MEGKGFDREKQIGPNQEGDLCNSKVALEGKKKYFSYAGGKGKKNSPVYS